MENQLCYDHRNGIESMRRTVRNTMLSDRGWRVGVNNILTLYIISSFICYKYSLFAGIISQMYVTVSRVDSHESLASDNRTLQFTSIDTAGISAPFNCFLTKKYHS